MTGYGGTVSFL
ncbi:hypothetical protein RDI58_032527 [Solanum bulbocastanum]